jgi:hypothetical protein
MRAAILAFIAAGVGGTLPTLARLGASLTNPSTAGPSTEIPQGILALIIGLAIYF